MTINFFILLFFVTALISLGNPARACEDKILLFEEYLGQLEIVDSNTAKYFNLKYLVQHMRDNGALEEELRPGLLNYITAIDMRMNGMSVITAYGRCNKEYAILLFEVDDALAKFKSGYISVSYIGPKMVNVSLENIDDLEDVLKTRELYLFP